MADKTKTQLTEELKAWKARHDEKCKQYEECRARVMKYELDELKWQEELAIARKRIGALESENTELEAFKKDALQAMDNQSKEIELMKENRKLADAIIEKQKNRIITLEGKTIDLATDIGAAYKSKHDLLTGSLVNLIREWMYQKYGIGKGGQA